MVRSFSFVFGKVFTFAGFLAISFLAFITFLGWIFGAFFLNTGFLTAFLLIFLAGFFIALIFFGATFFALTATFFFGATFFITFAAGFLTIFLATLYGF